MKFPVVFALALGACAPGFKQTPHDRPFQRAADTAPVPKPAPTARISDIWDHMRHSTVVPLGRAISPGRYAKLLIGGRSASDVNAFGQVPDSAWFTNRIGRRAVAPEVLERGPNVSDGPAAGPLTVIGGKPSGVTPGVVLRDAAGVVWHVKFDHPAWPELASGAEMVASRFLWAAGYHVPETWLVRLDLGRLRLAPNAMTRDEYGLSKRCEPSDLDELLAQLNPDAEGRLRSIFSRRVPGEVIGPFAYRGFRSDDANDQIPHERRRSLRGLRVLAAWLNNTDTRAQNTIDTFIVDPADPRRGHVRHYLIDFGDSLGAAGVREKHIGEGYEYLVDWPAIGVRIAALGLRSPYWARMYRSPFRSAGVFEADVFEPDRWKPVYANPAFIEATRRDELWAAGLLARFTPGLIVAAVATAEYTEPGAASYVAGVLIRRRGKLLRWVFDRMAPLDNPRVRDGWTVEMTDLEALAGSETRSARIDWSARWNRTRGFDRELARGAGATASANLTAALVDLRKTDGAAFADDPFVTVRFTPRSPDRPAVEVQLRAHAGGLVPVGLDREVE